MMSWARKQIHTLVALAVLAGVASSTLAMREVPVDLDAVRERGTLVVAVRPGPASWYRNTFGDSGFEFELVEDFARELGVRLEIREAASSDEALDMVVDGDVDIAVGVAVTPTREQQFAFTIPVQSIIQHVVCDRRQGIPATMGALGDKALLVQAGHHHGEQLTALKDLAPQLNWREVPDASEENLLAMVHQGQGACTVTDSNQWEFHRHLYPNLRVAFDLPGQVFTSWAFSQQVQPSPLRDAASAWLARRHADGQLVSVRDRQQAHLRGITDVDAGMFYRHIQSRLPRYVDVFRAAADRHGLDWRLLAAVAYQESLWNPDAVSPTGVQGLMQLTRDTAALMGIEDRTDPLASIEGGARYLRKLIDSLPADIQDPDRTWVALAAYNAGIAHVLDARDIVRRRGGNPAAWPDIRSSLPLLKQEQWYSQARYGYARGATQAVIYVRHVRRYYDLLVLASNNQRHDDMMLAMGPSVTGLR